MVVMFGNINIRIPNDKALEKLGSTENSLENRVSNANSYFFDNLYKKVYPKMTKSYKRFTKSMLKYAKSSMNNKTEN